MDQAIKPTPTNGCYGWLIWVNAGRPCIGPRITERPSTNERDFPGLPADMYRFSGLFGQLVTVFPSQDIVVVRTGQDRGLVFSGGEDWESGLYNRVLGSITDQRIKAPGARPEDRAERQPERRRRVPERAAGPERVQQGPGPGPAAAGRPRTGAGAAAQAGELAGEPHAA